MENAIQKKPEYRLNVRKFASVSMAAFAVIGLSFCINAPKAESAEPIAAVAEKPAVAILREYTTHGVYEEPVETGFVKIEPVAETENLGEFILTAYCPCVKCCEEWSAEHPANEGTGFVQKTASGTIPTPGRTISVDPSVIPFGTTVIINGVEYIAEDCGGAIKGKRIDILFETHNETLDFGKQKAEVFIKKEI